MPERGGVVSVIIKARDLASSVVGRFRRNLASISRTARDVTRAVVAWTVAMVAATIGLEKLAERGSKVIAVKRAFLKLTREETDALEGLRAAARGTIADFDLMSLHNQALALGSAKTSAEFGKQIEITRILGRAQGIEATEALQKFTVGMARLSRLRLDDLGITLKQVEADERYAAQIGKSAADLDENEKKIAFRTEAMRQAEILVERLSTGEMKGAEASNRFGIAIKNLGDRLAVVAAEAPLVTAFFDRLTTIATDIVDIIGGDTGLLIDGMKTLGRLMGDAMAVGINEALASIYGGGGPGDRLMRSLFQANADIARENLAANQEALASIARAARAQAEAREVRQGPAGQAVILRQRREEIALLERRQQILVESLRIDPTNEQNRALLAETSRKIQELEGLIETAGRIATGGPPTAPVGGGGEEGGVLFADFTGTRRELRALMESFQETRSALREARLEATIAPTEKAAEKAREEVEKLEEAFRNLQRFVDELGGEGVLAGQLLQIPGLAGIPGGGVSNIRSRFPRTPSLRVPLELSAGARAQMMTPAQAKERERQLLGAGEAMKTAQAVTVSAMFGMAQVAIAGSEQVAASVISMVTQILQSVSGDGIFGAIIGGVGGLIGAAFGRRDAVPVRVDDYGSRAIEQMREVGGGPMRITTIIEQGGVEIERIERELLDRQSRDETVRFGPTIGMGS